MTEAYDDKALQASIKPLKTLLTQMLKIQANPKIMATVGQLPLVRHNDCTGELNQRY